MNILGNIKRVFFERNSAGENWYLPLDNGSWCSSMPNLKFSENHPILTPALLFVSKIFSQAEFSVVNKRTGIKIQNHVALDLLNSPNFYQTRIDLLEALMFMQIANGAAALYTKKVIGENEPDSIYLLDVTKIKFPQSFKTPLLLESSKDSIMKTKVKYIHGDTELDIELGDILFFYDMPQGFNINNIFSVKSRLDGLSQTLINTKDSLTAKNIILKSNGKELITGTREGFPLDVNEKAEAENMFSNNYGLSKTRKRTLITKATLTWKSLHIALRDLGLDESVKVDGNLIYTALHIPKDILSLEAKKTTYENGKQSMISYIQNEVQSNIDSFCEVINNTKIIGKNEKLIASYEHLPIMQYTNKEKYESQKVRAEALRALLDAGIPEVEALKLLNFKEGFKLEKVENNNQNTNSDEQK